MEVRNVLECAVLDNLSQTTATSAGPHGRIVFLIFTKTMAPFYQNKWLLTEVLQCLHDCNIMSDIYSDNEEERQHLRGASDLGEPPQIYTLICFRKEIKNCWHIKFGKYLQYVTCPVLCWNLWEKKRAFFLQKEILQWDDKLWYFNSAVTWLSLRIRIWVTKSTNRNWRGDITQHNMCSERDAHT